MTQIIFVTKNVSIYDHHHFVKHLFILNKLIFPLQWVILFYPCYISCFRLCCCIHIYLSNTLLLLPQEAFLLCSLLALLHQTVQLHPQLLCVLQNLIL